MVEIVADDRQVIALLKSQHQDNLQAALSEYHEAKRALNRAEHEVHRIESHLARIDQIEVQLKNEDKEG